MLPKSVITSKGKEVTYILHNSAIGLGYLFNEKIYRSCGNGYYEDITSSVKKWYPDKGQKYMEKISKLFIF